MLPDKENLARLILASIKAPISWRGLIRQMKVERKDRQEFKKLLEELVSEGRLVKVRGDKYALSGRMRLIPGRLWYKDYRKYGWVTPEIERQSDIYISSQKFKGALRGDRVLVKIERGARKGYKPEGSVVRVIERAPHKITGLYKPQGKHGWIIPIDAGELPQVFVPPDKKGDAREGVYVIADIIKYPSSTRPPEGAVKEVLGYPEEPGIDVEVIIRKYDIPYQFPENVFEEADALPSEVDEEEIAGRTDFRHLPTITIDGERAQDFDDAVSVEKLPNGNYQLGVHIADVSHYVAEGSPIDSEAFRRGTSIYFPDKSIPMLPRQLSSGICSLNPLADRLTLSVMMEFDSQGNRVGYSFHPSVITSKERMTYNAVKKLLVNKDTFLRQRYTHLLESLELMEELCHLLLEQKRKRGSLDFELPEPDIIVDQKGEMTGIVKTRRNIAHRIIEEFMIAANETVAAYLFNHSPIALYRVHDEPDTEKIAEFSMFITRFGYHLPSSLSPAPVQSLQDIVKKVEGKPEEPIVVYSLLRSLKLAHYSEKNSGHYGLAMPIYTQFTSPIRRYPDLVVHRLLKNLLQRSEGEVGRRGYSSHKLGEIARQSSDRERAGFEAERELIEWKKVKFMSHRVGEECPAFIKGIDRSGLHLELEEYFVEGFLPISALRDDRYHYDESHYRLKGERTGRVLQLGEHLTVIIARVDRERRLIEFSLP